jgi:C1A family cysteine protease
MKAVFALSLLAAAASAITFKADPFWKAYKAAYGKTYESEAEEARRYEVFNKNMQMAAELNAAEGEFAEYGMTPVSDRFPEELFTAIGEDELSGLEPDPEPIVDAPASFDSRSKGWIPAIRSQGQCGSCWAFSTAATVSGSYAKKHGVRPPVLSEQQLVDCDTTDNGCNGGLAARALAYAKKGLMLNSDYSYKAARGSCKFKASKVKAKVTQVYSVSSTVAAMKSAIQNNAIISVRVNAGKLSGYKGGIVMASGCSTSPNHAVNAVGWGKSGSTAYWIIRNSWGSGWGESGYFRLQSGKNACGVEGWPVKVTVA